MVKLCVNVMYIPYTINKFNIIILTAKERSLRIYRIIIKIIPKYFINKFIK